MRASGLLALLLTLAGSIVVAAIVRSWAANPQQAKNHPIGLPAETKPVQSSPRAPAGDAPTPAPARTRDSLEVVDADRFAETPAVRKIQAALDSPSDFEFKETPLHEVVEQLKARHKIEIQLDFGGLKDAGVEENEPVTKSVRGISLRAGLRLLLDDLCLKYTVRHEALMITSPERAECDEFAAVRFYPVNDLVLVRNERGEIVADARSLVNTIKNAVSPRSWQGSGGDGSIEPYCLPDHCTLAVLQTQDIQDDLLNFLRALRRLKGGSGAKEALSELSNTASVAPSKTAVKSAWTAVGGDDSPGEAKIRAALDGPAEITCKNQPLRQVVEQLKARHKIEIQLDGGGLRNAGIDEEAPVTISVRGMSLRSALRLVLDEFQLEFVIYNEVLLITSPQKAEGGDFLETRIYPVTDLIQFRDEEGRMTSGSQPLIDLMCIYITPPYFDGERGSIRPYRLRGQAFLVVMHNQEMQERYAGFLAALERCAADEPKPHELPRGSLTGRHPPN